MVLEALAKCKALRFDSLIDHPNQGCRLQALTQHFSRKIHRLASCDQIANKAGVVGYAQFVLVPELTMRLVKEDMDVCDETARQIMRESIDIGEKVNPAPNDVVPMPEEGVGDTT